MAPIIAYESFNHTFGDEEEARDRNLMYLVVEAYGAAGDGSSFGISHGVRARRLFSLSPRKRRIMGAYHCIRKFQPHFHESFNHTFGDEEEARDRN
jgi:hypothetical protein